MQMIELIMPTEGSKRSRSTKKRRAMKKNLRQIVKSSPYHSLSVASKIWLKMMARLKKMKTMTKITTLMINSSTKMSPKIPAAKILSKNS